MTRGKPVVERVQVIDILDALSYLEVSGIYPNARKEWEDSLESWQMESMNSDSYHRLYLNEGEGSLAPVMKVLVKEFGLEAVGKYGYALAHHSY